MDKFNARIENKIERWKDSLLDLSKRNRLLNYKKSKRSNVDIVEPKIIDIYKKIVLNNKKLTFSMPVSRNDDRKVYEILSLITLISEPIPVFRGDIKTEGSIEERQKTLKNLRTKGKLSLEEQGINMLYLVCGFLKWKDKENNNWLMSPLILVPVSVEIKSTNDPYTLKRYEGDIEINPTLNFILERQHGIILPTFDYTEDKLENFLDEVQKIVYNKGWSVVTETSLGLLSFSKINMYKDLESNKDQIIKNSIIRAMCGDKMAIAEFDETLNNYNHDKNIKPTDVFQVVDADSSQQDAILFSKEGVSFVMQGPPGTGKSQTITNIIAEGLADGKKILFVSEKMAALDVVHKRLTEVGLSDFCLSLHSHKANKINILEELGKTLDLEQETVDDRALDVLSDLLIEREKLNEYNEQLHIVIEPLGMSIYRVYGEICKLKEDLDIQFSLEDIAYTTQKKLNEYQYAIKMYTNTIEFATVDYCKNPWEDCTALVITHEKRFSIESCINRLVVSFKNLSEELENCIDKYYLPFQLNLEEFKCVIEVLKISSESLTVPLTWIYNDNMEELLEKTKKYKMEKEFYQSRRNEILEDYSLNFLQLNAKEIENKINESVTVISYILNDKEYADNSSILLNIEEINKRSIELNFDFSELLTIAKDILNQTGIDKDITLNNTQEIIDVFKYIKEVPKLTEKWFEINAIEKADNLVEVGKSICKETKELLNENLKKYKEEIIDIDFREFMYRFNFEYTQMFKYINYYKEKIKEIDMTNHNTDICQKDVKNFSLEVKPMLGQIFNSLSYINNNMLAITRKYSMDKCNSINDLFVLSKLSKLVICDIKPTEIWFDENKHADILKTVAVTKEKTNFVIDKVNEINSQYNKEIFEIEYLEILKRYETEYNNIFEAFSKSRDMKQYGIKFIMLNFIPETKIIVSDAEKLFSEAFNAMLKITESYDIKKYNTIKDIKCLYEICELMVRNIRPTEIWFDEKKHGEILETVDTTKEKTSFVINKVNEINIQYSEAIFEIEYLEILKRYQTEYNNIFEAFRKSKGLKQDGTKFIMLNFIPETKIIVSKAEKLFSEAYNAMLKITESYEIKEYNTIKDIKCLYEICELMVKSIRPTEIWFDKKKHGEILETVAVTKEKTNFVIDKINEINTQYSKEIFEIEYLEILKRYQTEYNSMFEVFNKSKGLRQDGIKLIMLNFIPKTKIIVSDAEKLFSEAYNAMLKISESYDIKKYNTIKDIKCLYEICELMVMNIRPTEIWFDEKRHGDILETLDTTKKKTIFITNKVNEIKTQYSEGIFEIEYLEILKRYQTEYNSIFEAFSKSKGLRQDKIKSIMLNFIPETKIIVTDAEKLFSEAYNAMLKITESYDIKKYNTIKDIKCLYEICEFMVMNIRPAEIWFDKSKHSKILESIEETKKVLELIQDKKSKVNLICEKDVFDIDYSSMLNRFKVEYVSIFKVFKRSYRNDKKLIRRMYKSVIKNLKDESIVELLIDLKEIDEYKEWLSQNDNLIKSMLGNYYLGKDTNWNLLRDNFEEFGKLLECFSVKLFPQKIKEELIKGINENSVVNEYKKILTLQNSNIAKRLSTIFSDLENIEEIFIYRIIENLNSKRNTMENIERDYNTVVVNLKENYSNEIDDPKIFSVLMTLKEINENKSWLRDNDDLIKSRMGDYYLGENTVWNITKEKLNELSKLLECFQGKSFPQKIKWELIKGINENSVVANEYNKILTLQDSNIAEKLSTIFSDLGNIEEMFIDKLLEKLKTKRNTMENIERDYNTIIVNVKEDYADKIDDHKIFSVLMSLKEINENKSWLRDNDDLIKSRMGDYYLGENTVWNTIEGKLNELSKLLEYFSTQSFPEKIKWDLIKGINENSVVANEYNKILTLQDSNIAEKLSTIFSDLGNIEEMFIDRIIENLKSKRSTIENIERDYNTIIVNVKEDYVNEIDDSKIFSLLMSLKEIHENKGWLWDNDDLIKSRMGDYYLGENTVWDIPKEKLNELSKLLECFQGKSFPQKIKEELIKGINENSVVANEYNKILTLQNSNIAEKLSTIFSDLGNIEEVCIDKIIENLNSKKSTMENIERDYNGIISNLHEKYINEIDDNKVYELLINLKEINKNKQWLGENENLIRNMIGSYYLEENTEWNLINDKVKVFKSILDWFRNKSIPSKLHEELIQGIENWNDFKMFNNLMDDLSKADVKSNLSMYFYDLKDIEKININKLLEFAENSISTISYMEKDYKDILSCLKDNCDYRIVNEKDIKEIMNTVKVIQTNKKSLDEQEKELADFFQENSKGLDTNWEELKKICYSFNQIVKFFENQGIPQKTENMLLEKGNKKALIEYVDKLECIMEKNLDTRSAHLFKGCGFENRMVNEMSIYSNQLVESSDTILKEYSVVKQSFIKIRTYEDVLLDLNKLVEIQIFINDINENIKGLENLYEYKFIGIDTSWENILSDLKWVQKFKQLHLTYGFNKKFIEYVCTNKEVGSTIQIAIKELKESYNNMYIDYEQYQMLFECQFDSMNLKTILGKIQGCLNMSLLEEWINYKVSKNNCSRIGLGGFIERVEASKLEPTLIIGSFLKGFYKMWLDAITLDYPAVSEFRKIVQDERVEKFIELDYLQFSIAKARIRELLIKDLPNKNKIMQRIGEVAILRAELNKRSRRMQLRKLFKEIPNLLVKLKPCLMMSPLSVAYFLEAQSYNFDLVIFDEASQIRPQDSIGAIFRGSQVIIAGDKEQLPPTNFAQKIVTQSNYDDGKEEEEDDDEYDDIDMGNSILEGMTNVLPERTLLWHYRSRNEDLISFSNKEIYLNHLTTFPSNNNTEDNGVEYVYVENSVYENNCNEVEVERIVELIRQHIDKYPKRSLGVITFSKKQQSIMDDAVEKFKIDNPRYEWFFDENIESAFFIKNLENVQGDERDTIIISICYAKNNRKTMDMRSFGPLNNQGGYRRLNVAITRAKYNVKLVGSIMPSDIDLSKTDAKGVKMLRSYIEFAINSKNLSNEIIASSEMDRNLSFEENIAEILRSYGYEVDTQIGNSQYKIDIAVKHPEDKLKYVIGIECDGYNYHLAKTARDRDRLRQSMLKAMGWRLYRIWSTDWIKDPATEEQKLIKSIQEATLNFSQDVTVNNALQFEKYDISNFVNIEATNLDTNITELDERNPYGFDYYESGDYWEVKQDIADSEDVQISIIVSYIIEKEQPIHKELLYHRLAGFLGNKKVTNVIRDKVDFAISRNIESKIAIDDNFVTLLEFDNIRARIPKVDDEERSIDYISIKEIAVAMLRISENALGITTEDLAMETSRVFGFERKGPKINTAMELALEYLVQENKINIIEGKVQHKEGAVK